MGEFYRDYSDFLRKHFPGRKMQKLTVDAGFTCPNRDGTLSRGGCAYCNNSSFSPLSASVDGLSDIAAQLARSRAFFARKYPQMRYLAYFQSYTNTYGDIDRLLELYRTTLDFEGVDGLILGTRPDCLPDELLRTLAQWHREGRWIMIELGAESTHNSTLERVNRCHSWEATVGAVGRVRQAGLPVGLHLIMGLPGESTEDLLMSARRVAALHPDTVKFHQLQIVEGSIFGARWKRGEQFRLFTPEEYLELCCRLVEIFNIVSPSTAIERFTAQSPADILLAPKWNLKNYQFVNLLHNRLRHTAPPWL